MSKKVCFLYPGGEYVLDGIRSALGLAVENLYAYGAVVRGELPPLNTYHQENIEFLRDMEGDIFSLLPENVEKQGLTPITIEALGEKLREMDVIIPYGILHRDNQ